MRKISYKYVLAFVLVLVFAAISMRYFIFGILTLFSAIFGFYHDRVNKTPYDFRLTLFMGIIITRQYGLLFTFIYVVLSNVIPNIIAGGRIDGASIIFYGEFFLVYSIVLLFPSVNIITLGIILVITEAILGIFINQMFGVPGFVAVSAGAVAAIVRTIYFLTLGELVMFLFRFVP